MSRLVGPLSLDKRPFEELTGGAGNTTWFEGRSGDEGLASRVEEGAISMRDRAASVRGNVR